MTPAPLMSRQAASPAHHPLILAARIVRDAADSLGSEVEDLTESARYFLAADRIAAALRPVRFDRRRLLGASPALVERSGRTRTLVEMIEAEPEDATARFRLARLLFRALLWEPEMFPIPVL